MERAGPACFSYGTPAAFMERWQKTLVSDIFLPLCLILCVNNLLCGAQSFDAIDF